MEYLWDGSTAILPLTLWANKIGGVAFGVTLVLSPCKPIIAVRQVGNYIHLFHPLNKKKAKFPCILTSVDFLTKCLSVRKCHR